MKKTLNFLVLGCMLMLAFGMVSASTKSSTFTSPSSGEYLSGDSYLVEWNSVDGDVGYFLQYGEYDGASCSNWKSLSDMLIDETSFEWDTTSVDDGTYCLRLQIGDQTLGSVTGFTIDNTAPEIEFDLGAYLTETDTAITFAPTVDETFGDWSIDFGDGEDDEGISSFGILQHTYEEEGKYIVTLTVEDLAGNVNTVTTMVVVDDDANNYDWTISLSAEESNLISIPYVPESTDYSDVFGGVVENLDRIWSYEYDEDTGENKWVYRRTSGDDWSSNGDLNEIVPGRAYFVFMNSDDFLLGDAKTEGGDSDETPVLPPSVKLANGYNLISMFGDPADNSVASVLSSLTSLEGNPYWYKVLDKNYNEVSAMNVGQGYWVSMKHTPDSSTEDYYEYFL